MPEIFNVKILSRLQWRHKAFCPTNQEHLIMVQISNTCQKSRDFLAFYITINGSIFFNIHQMTTALYSAFKCRRSKFTFYYTWRKLWATFSLPGDCKACI